MTLSKRAQKLVKSPSAIVKGMLACAEDPYSEENKTGYLNFGIAENRLIDDLALSVLNSPIQYGQEQVHYGALEGSEKLRKAFCHFGKENLGIKELVPERVAVQSGLSSVCEAMAYAFFDEGDEIIAPSPYYSGFAHDFEGRFKVKLVSACATLGHNMETVRSALTKNTKALLLCHPHNPTGEVLSREFLKEAIEFCKENDLHLISDEIYALSIFDGSDHHSALNIDSDFKNLHFLYGMAKDFGLAGLKTGFYYSRNEEHSKAIQALGYFHPVSSVAQEIVANFFEGDRPRRFVKESNKRVKEALDLIKTSLPELSFIDPKAGMFFLADFRFALARFGSEEKVYEHLLNELKINVTPGKSMGMDEEGFFRVCFARPEGELREFSRRLSPFLKN